MARLSIIMLIILGLTLSAVSCDSENPEDVALQVAHDWTQDSVDEVASDIGSQMTGNLPVLEDIAASVIEEQIREGVSWNYSTPVKKSDGRYEVVAEAVVEVEITVPLLWTKTYDVSVDYELEVDTDSRRVVDSHLDLSSLRINEAD